VSIKWLVLGIEDVDFTRDERELLVVYRKLGQDDKVEIIGIISLKLQSEAKKGAGLYPARRARSLAGLKKKELRPAWRRG